MFILLSR